MTSDLPILLKLLIVEDSTDDVERLLLELQRAGFQPHPQIIQNEVQYLAALSEDVDVILTEYGLRELSAGRALQLLQEREMDVPLLVVTSMMDEAVVVQCMQLGAADYLLKDRLTRLGQAVHRALAQRRSRAEKRRAERALRESEEKFKAIFHESLDVILIADGESGHILSINDAANRVLGYAPNTLIGQHFSILFGSQVSDSEALPAESSERMFESNLFLRADGSLCSMDVTATIIPWAKGHAIMATLRDMTESRQAREALLRVELMSEELARERELVQLKENFISMVSHEFRTPLSVILTSTEMLEYYFERLSPQKRLDQLHKIKTQTEEMTALLDDVLFISRAKAGKLRFQPQQIDLATFCQDMIEHVKLHKGYQQHKIVFRQIGDVSAAALDEKLLQRILINLLENALKYSGRGSEILLEVRAEADQVTIKVVDHGIGIPPQAQPHLFEPFFRAENAHNVSGSGLGLVIAKNSVEIHEGTITYESLLGVGTTFTVTLPTVQKPAGLS